MIRDLEIYRSSRMEEFYVTCGKMALLATFFFGYQQVIDLKFFQCNGEMSDLRNFHCQRYMMANDVTKQIP